MKKTAVVYVGAMRSFDRCLATHRWHFLRKLDKPDFFVSTVKDADAYRADSLRLAFPEAQVAIDVVDEQPDCIAELRARGVPLPAEWVRGKCYTHEPFAISVHPQAVARQLWQLDHAWEVFGSKLADYDLIIRCRPDLWFHSCETIYHRGPFEAILPWWGRFGGVNDRFAALGTDAARSYFTTYRNIPALMAAGCPLHPESLMAASLEAGSCGVVCDLMADFSTLRTTGEMRPPEISNGDFASLLLR